METINLNIGRQDVFTEVEKATDYTGAKLIGNDKDARERIMAAEADLNTLERFWVEAAETFNERLKQMLLSYNMTGGGDYRATLEVSVSFDKALTPSVEKTARSFFIAFIIGEWFKLAKKDESAEYFGIADEHLTNVERILYSRRKPKVPGS